MSVRRNGKKMTAIKIAAIPSAIIVFGAPIYCDTVPINIPPKGCMPKTAIAKKLITLPLISADTLVCIMVLLTVD